MWPKGSYRNLDPQARQYSVRYMGYRFEVVDIDGYKIDQLLVTRIEPAPADKQPQESHPAA